MTPAPDPPRVVAPRLPVLSDAEQTALDAGVLRLFADDAATRVRGARTLAELGPKARVALKYVVDCVRREEDAAVAAACREAEGAIRPAAI
jgi:hypothetical protein